MENSGHIDGPRIESTPKVGSDLAFSYKIKNTNTEHNLPSGSVGAQPQLWVNAALVDPDGQNVWESGYIDSNGDIADLHSLDVAAGRIKTNQQLVHFQTKFLTTNVKGTEREMYLPVNFDIDPLPHLRPPQIPTTVLNHPRARAHGEPVAGPAGREASQVRRARQPDHQARQIQPRLPHAEPCRADLLHALRRFDQGHGAEHERADHELHAFAVDVDVKAVAKKLSRVSRWAPARGNGGRPYYLDTNTFHHDLGVS